MTITIDDLRSIEILQGAPEGEITWLAEACEERAFTAGEVLYAIGADANDLIFLVTGKVDVLRRDDNGQETATFTNLAGDTAGRLPFSRMTAYNVEFVGREAGRLALLDMAHFPALRTHAPVTEERLVHRMLDRTRDVTRFDLGREKLASLGTMAAGLAHELNNPASAARRTAQEMARTLQAFDEHSSNIVRAFIFRETDTENDPFEPVYAQMTLESPAKDTLEESDLEDELGDWLDAQGVAEPWTIASTLVQGGFTRAFLEDFATHLVPDQVRNFLEWVPRDVEMRLLARELVESTKRIAELVQAMKSYSYMDQSVVKGEVDLHDGIDTTVRILRHKLQKKDIQVIRRFAEDLPKVPGYGSELNQVWTNLIDNAVQAMNPGGTLTLASTHDRNAGVACIDVIDDGAGIPEDVQQRIFEPFFTTRAVGEGTGLGLDITHRIVVQHHQGNIQVRSRPGETRFRVRLPFGGRANHATKATEETT